MKIQPTHAIVTLTLCIATAFLVGRLSAPGEVTPGEEQASVPAAPEVWTCSMHPQVRQPEPGQCPICFMDLIPATEGGGADLGPRTLSMSPSAVALAEIATAPVERREVTREVEMVGKVALDQTRLSHITAWVPGRLDQLFVDSTGVPVRKGDHLVEIYSPKLYSAQQELLQAIQAASRLEEGALEILRSTTDRTVHSAREKLRLYGFSDEQLAALVERGTPKEHVTLYASSSGVVLEKQALEGRYVDEGSPIYTIADLSKVWVVLDAYESDLAWLRYGQDVQFEVGAYPGEVFHGRVALIDPVLDDRTRTVKVRLNVSNEDRRLKPDMFVSASARARLTTAGKAIDEELAGKWMCPMHPEVSSDEAASCTECGMALEPVEELGFGTGAEVATSLVVPRSAPLVTGRRAVVYVRVPEAKEPTFEGRVVRLGPRAGEWYVILAGLEEGEEVVVHGNFKLDSELEIRGKLSMMNPGEDEREERPELVVPAAFRADLGRLAQAAVTLQVALAADLDDPVAASRVRGATETLDAEQLFGPARARWDELAPALQDSAGALVAATDLEARRTALLPLTLALLAVLDDFGYEHEGEAFGLFHCPMAFDGQGGDWLQLGEVTANPYYGSSMLRCGSRTRLVAKER